MPETDDDSASGQFPRRWVSPALLTFAAALVCCHYAHLAADFPHDAPWQDPARMTDEGWYAGAALRALLSGHWRVAGDFNPAVALPVFPAVVYALFHITGVSVSALRALNVSCFAASVALTWVLVRRYSNATWAAGAALLFAANPLYFVYSRLGILEPLLVLEMMAALLLADRAAAKGNLDARGGGAGLLRPVLLGLLMAVMLLTKTTGLCAFPALLYLLWVRAPGRARGIRDAVVAMACCGAVVLAYVAVVRQAGLMRDFVNLFAINADRANHRNVLRVFVRAVRDGRMVGICSMIVFAFVAALTPLADGARQVRSILAALALSVLGYGAFITYHSWLMPRYYIPLVPLLSIGCGLGIHALNSSARGWMRCLGMAMAGVLLVAAVTQGARIARWTARPSYNFRDAAMAIRERIEAEGESRPVVLSSSGEEVALLNREPGEFINVQFGTGPLRERIEAWKPGWMIAFGQPEGEAVSALRGIADFQLVLARPALGGARPYDKLLLYRLTPAADGESEQTGHR